MMRAKSFSREPEPEATTVRPTGVYLPTKLAPPWRRTRIAVLLAVVLMLVATACPSSENGTPPGDDGADSPVTEPAAEDGSASSSSTTVRESNPEVPTEVDDNGFDDHTVSTINSVDEYFALARNEEGRDQSVVKFTIPDLAGEDVDARNTRWFDSNFYSLHDEWYWFRLLNGQPVPRLNTDPVDDLEFETIDDAYAYAEALEPSELPLDLRFTDGGRLYSNEYYDLALRDEDKTFGLGSLIHFPLNELSDKDRWVFELEFSEDTTPETVDQFFTALTSTLPAEIADELAWVVRSPHQRDTAETIADDGGPYAERVVEYRDLVPQGEVAVYNEGLAAGRLRLIAPGEDQLTDAVDGDILIMENVPDWLPPASALLTSAPQTPLAHVNLLARNRGIPNASISGLLSDPAILQAGAIRSFAIVRASGDELEITLITRDQYDEWTASQTQEPISVPAVQDPNIPAVVDLNELASELASEAGAEGLSDAQLDRWRPIIGGKAAGFVTLRNSGFRVVSAPDQPLAVTVAVYNRHLAQAADELDAMLNNDEFQDSARARFLLLEGGEDYANAYPDPDDTEFLETFTEDFGDDEAIAAILDADGFKKLLRDQSINGDDLETLTDALEANFGSYAATQGLRFRSSSSVEDIEGFSGAGLYDSNTGYLEAASQPDEDDQNRTVEWAIKKTWASYWGFEAYEERRREQVDHRSGAMAVLVHARFDDDLELNNGVATVTLTSPEGDGVANINTQQGAVSVTNPDPENIELPEVVEVEVGGPGFDSVGPITIIRRDRSTLSPDAEVLNDFAVNELMTQLVIVTRQWREQLNASLDEDQQVTTVSLDFEFKTMDDGWPALENQSLPGRLVIKQARSLDPGLRGISDELLAAPIPRDVLARAAKIDRLDCTDGTRWSILTDPLVSPDLGFAETPLEIGSETDGCTEVTVLVTPNQLLVDLLATGTGLDLAGSN